MHIIYMCVFLVLISCIIILNTILVFEIIYHGFLINSWFIKFLNRIKFEFFKYKIWIGGDNYLLYFYYNLDFAIFLGRIKFGLSW